jgi:hypothetical protein
MQAASEVASYGPQMLPTESHRAAITCVPLTSVTKATIGFPGSGVKLPSKSVVPAGVWMNARMGVVPDGMA